MNIEAIVLQTLDEVLSLGGRTRSFTRDTPLLGVVAELDSMAVVSLITALEDRLGVTFDEDNIDGTSFATVGALCDLVTATLG